MNTLVRLFLKACIQVVTYTDITFMESPSADGSNLTAAKLAEDHLKKDIHTKTLLEIQVGFHAGSSQRDWE